MNKSYNYKKNDHQNYELYPREIILALSIDGVVPLTHDHFRKRADLKLIEKNVMGLINAKEAAKSELPSLVFNMVGYPDILYQTDEYVDKWLSFSNSIMISKFRPIGSRYLWDLSHSYPFQTCPHLYNQAVISITGDVVLCCEDIHMDVPLGNIKQNSLLDIYRSSRLMKHYRTTHELGDISKLKLCRDCHIWGADILLQENTEFIKGVQVNVQKYPSGSIYRKC
ncbi:radical SAM protein [Candidatus Magnetomorum sp. HK-1]|nr:radical SAM protein [Candidatus Magnetomorum sp. HK-1]